MNGKIYTGTNLSIPFNQDGVIKDFAISGNSKQATRSGKNLFNSNVETQTLYGLTMKNSSDGGINISGTNERDQETNFVFFGTWSGTDIYINLDSSKSYTISIQGNIKTTVGFNIKGIKNGASTKLIYYSDSNNKLTISGFTGISYISAVIYNSKTVNTTLYLQIEEGTIATDYEPYGVSPSPDYPSEIKSCGDNIQLFDKDNANKISLIPSGGTNMRYVSSSIISSIYIPITGGKTYKVSRTVLTNRFSVATSSDVPTLNGSLIDFYGAGTKDTYCSLTTSSSAKYLCVYLTNDGVNFDEALKTLKIEEDSKATPWTPYGQGGINIKKENKNLYNYKDISNINADFKIDDEGWVTLTCDNTQGSSAKYFNYFTNISKILKPDTYYSIILEVKTVSGEGRLYINSIDKTNITQFPYSPDLANYFNNLSNNLVKKTVIKTLEDFSNATIMLRSFLMFPIGQSGSITFRISIIEDINIDIENFKYIPHQEQLITVPIQKPFRAIGDYKDTFVKIDGKWYEKHYIGKVELDGINVKFVGKSGTANNFFVTDAITNMKLPATNSEIIECLNTHFIGTYSTNGLYSNGNNIGQSVRMNGSIGIGFGINSSITTVELANSWLSDNNVIAYYPLQTPELIECTEEQNEILKELSVFTPITHYFLLDEVPAILKINTNSFVPIETTQMQAAVKTIPNEQTKINLELWSHDDKFIDTLYSSDYEFDGQCIDPKITLNANGSKTLTLDLPLYIIDKKTGDYIENPRWSYITQQYKIRVKQNDRINEFVLKDYTESHDNNDQLLININAQSLEEFELSQIGYNIVFNEDSLYKYNTNDNPNDPDTVPIGTYEPDIHFWNSKLFENSDWTYRVESYYPIDKSMDIDNRQVNNPELGYKNGKEQFYEEDRIIDYTEDNEPIYSDEYEVKKRIIKEEKSNKFNIIQTICEAFECWPTFEIVYKNDKIVSKTVVYKNDVPQDAKFSINYTTNLNSIQRTVDSSQIVTKMYVTPIDNENVDNGIVSIATNPKNFMKENYLLDLSWYLGEERLDTDIKNKQLIDPNTKMHFTGTNFSEPLFTTIDTQNTKETIDVYKKNIRARNIYIENSSLQLTKDQEELINLKTEREYVQSQKDSAQETINNLIDEMSLIGNTELRKENKTCYLYKENNSIIIRFSEIGIKAIPSAQTFNSPINIVSLDGIPFYDADKVSEEIESWKDVKTLELKPYKVDPIIGTILECQITNAKIGSSTDLDYASFKCSFDYDPYDYYKKLISYWKSKLTEAENRLEILGKSREDGGSEGLIYDLEGQIAEEKRYIFQAQQQKAQVVKEFESKFNPYIREGYWENTDFGIYKNKEQEKVYIPDESKELKYGQTEKSTSEELDKYNWSKDYVVFKVPDILINNGQGGTAYLYNVIDIDEIEVMNDNPLNENDLFRTYVKGTDYTINYGYTSNTPSVTENNRGIYLCFYEPEVNTDNNYIPQFNSETQIYVKVKARGDVQYIWSGFIKSEYYTEGQDVKRKWFCPLEQRISIEDNDIILSSIIVKANTSKINYDLNNNLLIENTQYELKYGKDYYTSKEVKNGKIVSRITLYQTTNVPLMDFQFASYSVQYNQDITAKYYYNDSLEVMQESSIPQTTYTINVLDISEANNFLTNLKWYKPEVGTRVPIYDEELRFRGLVGFINTITFDLLNPQNTQLSITNFKDKFVDLFQKITASTIALQSKEYAYDRSTQIVTVDGGINKQILKDTFERPDSNFTVTPNSNIKWDYSGITSTSDKLNENGVYAQVKVTPNGIFTANKQDEFGNYIWTTAITPQGINASQLNIGTLDTRQIQIFNSSEPRFTWNENGLYAYGQNNGKTDYETYVLYNENGIKFRQLMNSTQRYILTNLVKSPLFENLGDWTLSSTDNNVFDSENTGIIKEVEIKDASLISVYQAMIVSNKQTNNITLKLNSTKKDLNRDHKYYFRVYVKVNNIPELTNIDVNAGFIGFYKNIQCSQNNQYIKIDGFVTGIINDNNFAINVVLPNAKSNWSIVVKKPMILDVTDIFGDSIPSSQWFSDLSDIVDTGTWETNLDIYGDALKLDWGGLTIGAQNNSLQLTSQNGLVIYHPVTAETGNEKRMRLQLGQWQEPAKDKYGNIITNGNEVVYEEMYGLRANDLNGNMIFKVTQRGVEFDFTSNLEQTIKNYSAEAALEAISSTNTSNLLKNSCGYVYEEIIDKQGNPTGSYNFFDWEIENSNYLFPIDEKYTQKDVHGGDVPIVEGTISRHAFKMGGDTNTNARPQLEQVVNVATSQGVVQPFTFKFLMKGISNLQTEVIKNGIHLEIWEAGNEEDISVDIPYIASEGEWQIVKYTIFTEMPQITVRIRNISTITVDSNNIPTNGVIYLSDLMLTAGKDTPAWTVSPGEVYNNYVTIGSEGVVVTSDKDATGSVVRTVMDSRSFRVETLSAKKEISTNILVNGDNTTLGPTHIKGQCDIGAITRLRFIENNESNIAIDYRNPGIDITLIKG